MYIEVLCHLFLLLSPKDSPEQEEVEILGGLDNLGLGKRMWCWMVCCCYVSHCGWHSLSVDVIDRYAVTSHQHRPWLTCWWRQRWRHRVTGLKMRLSHHVRLKQDVCVSYWRTVSHTVLGRHHCITVVVIFLQWIVLIFTQLLLASLVVQAEQLVWCVCVFRQ